MQHFYSFVFQVCHWRCPPFSPGHVAFEFICLPGLSLLVPALFRGHVAFLFICLPGLSLLVSALFRWRRNISIHSPISVLLGVLNSFLKRGRPFCHCWCPPFSAGHAAFHFICIGFFTFVSQVRRALLVSTLIRWRSPCPPCPPSVTFVSLLVSLLVGHCVRLVAIVWFLPPLCFLFSPFLSPFLLAIVSVLSPFCFLLSPFLSPFLLMSVWGLRWCKVISSY